jgi:prepilin-type N-terminal cleavage/methylation domain-containing protein
MCVTLYSQYLGIFMYSKLNQTGLTLLELAIVITILGLLAGGVVLSRDLIRSSELVAVGSEYARYVQSIGSFQEKYHALPGDFTGATALWGLVSTDPDMCLVSSVGNNETCDGDGDGQVTNFNKYNATAYEQFRAWQHLGNAQLIDGNYSGTATGYYDRIPGKNIPASKLSGAGWAFLTITTHDISNGASEIIYNQNDTKPNQLLWLGASINSPTSQKMGDVLTPVEAMSLDQKMDDGLPKFGKIIAQQSANTCDNGTAYLTTAKKTCALVFKTGL